MEIASITFQALQFDETTAFQNQISRRPNTFVMRTLHLPIVWCPAYHFVQYDLVWILLFGFLLAKTRPDLCSNLQNYILDPCHIGKQFLCRLLPTAVKLLRLERAQLLNSKVHCNSISRLVSSCRYRTNNLRVTFSLLFSVDLSRILAGMICPPWCNYTGLIYAFWTEDN